MKLFLKNIKPAYIFNILAVLLMLGVGYIYDRFEDTKDGIVKINLKSQIEYTKNIAANIKRDILMYSSSKSLYDSLKKDSNKVKQLEEHLNLFITKRYRYVYLIYKKGDEYRFLADGSSNEDEKSDFDEDFEPINKEIWDRVYKTQKEQYYTHEDNTNLWMTYISPIVYQGKTQALLVIDFALEDHERIKHILHELDENFEAILLFFIAIFFIILWFSYLDIKREQEKERISEQLKELNEELEVRIEEEIKKSREKDKQMLKQSKLAQMGEMISMIAHQWRQPLSAISSTGVSMLLKAKLNKLDKKLTMELAQNVIDYSQHLSNTIDDFREFFKQNKEKRETSCDEVVISTLHIVEESIKNKNIKIVKELNSSQTFNTYPNELKQVVLNLIKNAEDILLDKKIEDGYINIRTYEKDGCLNIIVEDNAGGVPEDIIDKIFDPYFSTKTKKDGTGLGLYMSKIIIEEHCKGKIEVKNGKNGAVFKISIPKEGDS